MEYNFDPQTGEPIKKETTSTTINNQTTNGLAIAGLILSFFSGILGLIFSIMGLNESKKNGMGKGVSIAGIIISASRLVIEAVTLIFFITVFGFVWDEIGEEVSRGYRCEYKYECVDNGNGTSNCKYNDGKKEIKITCDNDDYYSTTTTKPKKETKLGKFTKEISIEGDRENVTVEGIKSNLGYYIAYETSYFVYEPGETEDKFTFIYDKDVYFTIKEIDYNENVVGVDNSIITGETKKFAVTIHFPDNYEYLTGIVTRMESDINSIVAD